jgi:acetyl esterase/lipase
VEFLDAFIGNSDPAHPLLSPIFHTALSKLPYVYTATSNKDPMNDDAMMLRHKLKQEGVEVTLKEYDGYPHFFHILSQLKMSQQFMADLAQAIRERCG